MASNRRALCVGINQYKNYPTATLQGCLNDVDDMRDVLQKYLGFTSGDITPLKDNDATKTNIMNNLKDMVSGAKNGKYVYLVYSHSSHGTQVPDKNREEPDKKDEAFCPYDLAAVGGDWDRNHIITDDELHDLFVQFPKNVLLEVYLDTCHSGTGLKAIDLLLDRKPRFLPSPSRRVFDDLQTRTTRGLYTRMLERGIVHHILWAGCKSYQTSADALIDGTWHGAFTYYFCKNMRESQNRISRRELITRINRDLSHNGYTQVAQLECEATVRTVGIGPRSPE